MKNCFLFFVLLLFITLSTSVFAYAQERYITTSDGVKLYVKVSGKGQPCLFIHGGPGQGSLSFEQMGGSNLEKYAEMIYLDQRGSGKSVSSANYSLERMLRDIDEVRKALGYKKIFLLSHSFGGVIAANYAKKYPARVSGLILANSTLFFDNSETIRESIKYAGRLLNKDFPIAAGSDKDTLKKTWSETRKELSKNSLGYKILTDDVNTIRKMNSIDDNPSRNIDFGTAVITNPQKFSEYYVDFTPLTALIKAHVLVITGTKDYAVGVDHYLSFHFPNQTVKIIPGGHLLYYENNETFVQAINSFINHK